MIHSTSSLASMEASSERPLVTRGLRRQQQKLARKRAQVPADTLVVGIDLAREHQAISYVADGTVVARQRIRCEPQRIDQLLPHAHQIAQRHGRPRIVIAFEPAGHYWCLAAESLERAGASYVLVQPLSVARAREESRYTPEKTDPRDADLIAELVTHGRFTDARLSASHVEDALWQLARDYFRCRSMAAAERTRLRNFWHRTLPEFFSVLKDPSGATALAVAAALAPFSELSRLTTRSWLARVRRTAAGRRILASRAAALLPLIKAAHSDLVRRSGEGAPFRIRHAAERRALLDRQKQTIRSEILQRYQQRPEAVYLDSIPGSDSFYNALTLAIVGDFHRFDDPRAIVKLAGSEVNQFTSGDWRGTSRISHRGRSPLRAAAYQQARKLVSSNPDFGARFYALLNRTAPRPRLTPQEAYVAVMNSYLRIAHVLITHQQLYVPLAERRSLA